MRLSTALRFFFASVSACSQERSGIVDQVEQLADVVEGEAELATVPDEGQPVEVPPVVAPLVAFAAQRLGHEADPLVIAHRLDLRARPLRELADRQDVGARGICLCHDEPSNL